MSQSEPSPVTCPLCDGDLSIQLSETRSLVLVICTDCGTKGGEGSHVTPLDPLPQFFSPADLLLIEHLAQAHVADYARDQRKEAW